MNVRNMTFTRRNCNGQWNGRDFGEKIFLKKRVNERILHELFSPKKRARVIGRLSHGYEKVLNEKLLQEIVEPISNPAQVLGLLKSSGAGEDCYAISFNHEIDGKRLSLSEALDHAFSRGLPSILVYPT